MSPNNRHTRSSRTAKSSRSARSTRTGTSRTSRSTRTTGRTGSSRAAGSTRTTRAAGSVGAGRTGGTSGTVGTFSTSRTPGQVNLISSGASFNQKRLDKGVLEIRTNRAKKGRIMITRRHLLYGAVGVGIVAAGGTGIKFVKDKIDNDANKVNTLEVSKSSVVSSNDFTEVPSDSFMKPVQEYSLPHGTLAWANDSNLITCLVPTSKPKPLTTVDVINTSTGQQTTVIESSQGQKHGYEIYDVRANENGVIWTEVNILQGEWHVYCSDFSTGYNINPILIDKGDEEFEAPSIAVSGKFAYWQVLPKADGKFSTNASVLKRVSFGHVIAPESDMTMNVAKSNPSSNDIPNVIYVSKGRMATPISPYNDGVVITPRANSKQVFYQPTYIDNASAEVRDSLVLPQNMNPLEACYGETGLCFSFDAIYNYGEGIANLGTYCPMTKPSKDGYIKWLNFTRTPSAPPAWCDKYYIIRSTMSVCAIDLNAHTYSIMDRPNASDDYGDYLASSGKCNKIVTYANIFDQPVTGDPQKYCKLRVWEKA